jgi:hypothetical protein
MTLLANGTDYGSLNALVHATSELVSATIAIIALWWLRPSLTDIPEGLIKAGEVVFTTVGIGLVWTQLSELWSSPALIKCIEILSIGLLISIVGLTTLSIGWTLLRNRDTQTEARVLGGLWLRPDARKVKDKFGGVQGVYEAFLYNAADTWSTTSRLAAHLLFLVFDLGVVVCGSVALASVAVLLLIYEVPKVHEFSVSPVSVEGNGTATIRWKVSHASHVKLEPFGEVASEGARIETITKNTDFRLTATNSFGNRNIEQGVAVQALVSSPSVPQRRPATRPQSRTTDIVIEARTCLLKRNVVIRGAGWLETENEKDLDAESLADCSVEVPRGGKYEIFVTYAANESWPVRVTLNQLIIDENALAAPTGGWDEPNQQERSLGVWAVSSGQNTLEFYRSHPIPHIQRIRFRLSS